VLDCGSFELAESGIPAFVAGGGGVWTNRWTERDRRSWQVSRT
jgi:hypothetical protein